MQVPTWEIHYVLYRTSTGKCANIGMACSMTFNKPAQPPDDASDHPTMPADERGRRSQPGDNDRARWLQLADAALQRAPSEDEIAETEALARKEQEKIKRRIRPTAEKVKRHSKSRQ